MECPPWNSWNQCWLNSLHRCSLFQKNWKSPFLHRPTKVEGWDDVLLIPNTDHGQTYWLAWQCIDFYTLAVNCEYWRNDISRQSCWNKCYQVLPRLMHMSLKFNKLSGTFQRVADILRPNGEFYSHWYIYMTSLYSCLVGSHMKLLSKYTSTADMVVWA